MLQHLKAWWAAHVTWIAAVVSFLDPSIQNWISQHPNSSIAIGGVWMLILHQLQPPRSVNSMNAPTIGIILAAALLLFAPTSSAQIVTTTAAPPPGWVFSVSGGYSNVTNAPTNNGVAIVTELKLGTFKREYFSDISARGDVFLIQSPNVTGSYVGPQFTIYKTAVNGASTEFFGNVGVGDIRSNDPTNTLHAKFSWKIGGGFNVRMSDHTFLRPLDVSYIRGSVFQGGGTVIGNHLQAAAMLGVRF